MGFAYRHRLLAHQKWVEASDTQHPSWEVVDAQSLEELGYRTCDIAGTDPYPIGESNVAGSAAAAGVHLALNRTIAETDSAKPLWMVVQAMNWLVYDKTCRGPSPAACHTPTRDEFRSMMWQTIAGGANGIFVYMFTDLFKNPDVPFDVSFGYMSEVAAEVLSFAPMLLSDAGPAPRPTTHGADSDSRAQDLGWLMTRAQWVGEDKSCSSANTSRCVYWLATVSDGTGSGRVRFDFSNRLDLRCDGASNHLRSVTPLGSSTNGSAAPRIDGCGFTDLIPVLGLRVYNITGLTSA